MHEMWKLLLAEARGMWRFRWYAVAVAWLVAAVAAFAVYSLPDRYQAEARVSIDTESVLQPLLQGMAVQPDFDTRVRMMTQTLFSRDNLLQIARETDLLLAGQSAKTQQQVLDGLKDGITLRGSKDNDVYTISYTNKSAQVARRVVQSTLDILVEQTLGSSQSDSASARKFLQNQVKEYEQRLDKAEEKLAEFKRQNTGLLPDEGGRGYYDRLSSAQQQLSDLQERLRAAENQKQTINNDIADLRQKMASGGSSPRAEALQSQIQDAEQKLNDLLLKYTPQHPDVKAMKDRLQRLRHDYQEARDKPSEVTPADLQQNPVYQQLQIELNKVNREIATVQPKITEQKHRIDELKSKVDQITQVEKRLSSLTRDYDVTKKQYEQLLTRLNTAQLSGEAERSGSQMQLRIIDPPVLPLSPSGPPRRLMMIAVLLASLGAGGGLAFLLHQLRPVFLDSRTLSEVTGRPVLGGISRVLTDTQRRAMYRESAGVVVVTGLLVVTVGLGVVFAQPAAQVVQAWIAGIV